MTRYTGRFAPSPTGPLHLGSLYTAVASYLDARANHGRWLLRIEDLDPPREQPGATESIIHSLQAHGLHWDGEIVYQSRRHAAYDAVITRLLQENLAYYCECSRQQLHAYPEGYPGFCRHKGLQPAKPCAIRLKADPPAHSFTDRLLGLQHPPAVAAGLVNDFVIYRKDGFYAYQLAVVADDIAAGVTHVVRGSDILDSTFKQEYLYRYLHQPLPLYMHLPVLTHADGQKLSKQNLAPAIDDSIPCANLIHVLQLLGQDLPPPPQQGNPLAILDWATAHWDTTKIRRTLAIPS